MLNRVELLIEFTRLVVRNMLLMYKNSLYYHINTVDLFIYVLYRGKHCIKNKYLAMYLLFRRTIY